MENIKRENEIFASPTHNVKAIQEQATEHREQVPFKHPHGGNGENHEHTPRKHPHGFDAPVATNVRMNEAFTIIGNWNKQMMQLQETYPLLTNIDLQHTLGNEEHLLARMETRLNKTRAEVIAILTREQTEKF